MTTEPGGPPGSVPLVARLHPNRGPGVWYAVLAGLVLAIVLGSFGTNLASGSVVMAVIILLAGGALAAFLAYLSAALLGPLLLLGEDGVRGRLAFRRPIDLRWEEVGIEADPDPPRGRFELDLGAEKFEVSARSWVGFADLVLVLATTTAALERMTPTAIEELVRLLAVEGPTTTADVEDL